jgi:hypothetical protein
VEDGEQGAEGQQIEDRTDQAEHDHEALDIPDVPALRAGNALGVHIVAGDGQRGKVRQEVFEQDLLGRQRHERQQRRGQCHADHVAEVGAGGDRDVFQRVGKGATPVLYALAQNVEIAAEQDDVGTFARHIDGFGDRDADIGGVERRRVVDPVALVADRVAGPL